MKITVIIYKKIIAFFNLLPTWLGNGIIKTWKISRVPNNKFYKDLKYKGIVKIKTKKSHFYMYSAGGTIENELFWKGLNGYLEPETVWIWEVLLSRGVNHIFDIGANSGFYSLLSKALKKESDVIAFEPSDAIYKRLVLNIKKNDYDILAEKIAISDKNEELLFFDLYDENQTNASLSPEMIKNNKNIKRKVNEYYVNVCSIDNYIKKHEIKSIDLVKIDVELHEPNVFNGMKRTIKKFKPFLLFEVLTDDVAYYLNNFFANIEDYKICEFVFEDDKFYLKEIESLKAKPDGQWNFFAYHIEKSSVVNSVIK